MFRDVPTTKLLVRLTSENLSISLFAPGFCLLSCILLALSPAANGDPVNDIAFTVEHPDGTRVEVRVWGDEYYRVVESLDGYALVRDPATGETHYAQLSPDGDELISTGVLVEPVLPARLQLERHLRINPASARSKIAAARALVAEQEFEILGSSLRDVALAPPNNGNVQGIVLLVDFSDQVGTIAPAEIDDYCNLSGYSGYGNNGSIRDYFHEVSEGNLTYTNFVPTTYYRANQPKSWYDDSSVPCCSRARGLILEALNDLDAQGFDFSQYDSNNDGLIDAINVFYAGSRNGPWSYGLWPHSSSITFSADGVSAFRYQITDIGSQLRLRTFCHENGHMICYWPDLYDYGYESTGVGNFCLMGYGASNTNPAEPCAYMKDLAGWSTTTLLTGPQVGLTAPSGTNVVYKFEHPTAANEYYLVENRQRTGRDANIPDSGLAIWHIDTFGSNNYEQMDPIYHYLVTLVQADGDWDLENGNNYGDSTDMWAAPAYTECGPETDPNTDWWDGSQSDLNVLNISSSSSTMTFSFNRGGDCNANGIPDEEDIANGTSADTDGNGIPDECECDWSVTAPLPESEPSSKNRFLTVIPTNAGQRTALRVRFMDLPAGFEQLEETVRWVGQPSEVTEDSGSADPAPSPTTTIARLRCTPHFMDWGAVGIVHVTGTAIVPGGQYQVRAVHEDCNSLIEASFSAALSVASPTLWGDVTGGCATSPCTPPNGTVDFIDISAVVDKFTNLAGAPSKTRTDLAPAVLDLMINFEDIGYVVDAFRGESYAFDPPGPCS